MMIKTRHLLLSLGLAALSASAAADESSQWYSAVHGGVSNPDSWPAQIEFGGPTSPGKIETRPGANWGFVAGRQIGLNRVELEVEFGNQRGKRAEIEGDVEKHASSIRYSAVLINALRDIELSESTTAFVGAGIGIGKVSFSGVTMSDGCECFAPASASGTVWQVRAGLEYKASEQNRFFAQITHLALPEIGQTQGLPATQYSYRSVNALSVGFRHMY